MKIKQKIKNKPGGTGIPTRLNSTNSPQFLNYCLSHQILVVIKSNPWRAMASL